LCSCPCQWWMPELLTVQCLAKRDCCGCCHPGSCIAAPKDMPPQTPSHTICYNTEQQTLMKLCSHYKISMKNTACRFLDKTSPMAPWWPNFTLLFSSSRDMWRTACTEYSHSVYQNTKTVNNRPVEHTYCHMLVTRHRVWTGNWIYWILTTNNHKSL
jgi:hypothetical protein